MSATCWDMGRGRLKPCGVAGEAGSASSKISRCWPFPRSAAGACPTGENASRGRGLGSPSRRRAIGRETADVDARAHDPSARARAEGHRAGAAPCPRPRARAGLVTSQRAASGRLAARPGRSGREPSRVEGLAVRGVPASSRSRRRPGPTPLPVDVGEAVAPADVDRSVEVTGSGEVGCTDRPAGRGRRFARRAHAPSVGRIVSISETVGACAEILSRVRASASNA